MAISKVCRPDNFESHNSLKLSFMNIQGLHSNFVYYESFLEKKQTTLWPLFMDGVQLPQG